MQSSGSTKIWGVNNEYISAMALDDLECVWGCTRGFLDSAQDRSVPVLCCFDDEEVGSNSPQGAASTILADTLDRICNALEKNQFRMLAQSFMVSADNAQALHPNPKLERAVERDGEIVFPETTPPLL